MGTPDFAVPCLRALNEAGREVVGVVTQPDRPRGRGGRVSYTPVKEAAQELGIEVYQPERVRRPEAVEIIRAWNPDLLVVVAFGQILPPSLLEIPKLGSINVHASLLPKYRGAAPIHWAVINGETETGITTMWMDAGLDTGDMILKSTTPIAPDETTGDLHDRLAAMGAGLLVETLRQVEAGRAPRQPQDSAQATYAPLVKPEHEAIDWGRSAAQIHNQIRGMNPWPVAHTYLGSGRVKVWRSSLPAGTTTAKEVAGLRPGTGPVRPGQVAGVVRDIGIAAGTGEGLILIEEVQPENGRRMRAVDFARGRNLMPGEAFAVGPCP